MIRVLIADDHVVVCAGVAQWLESHDDLEVVGLAHDGDTAVTMAFELRPDVVVMDLRMPGVDGIEATRRIRAELPTEVVALTTYFDPATVNAALDAGARGYFLKDVAPSMLADGIRSVVAGEMALSPKIATMLFDRSRETDPFDLLTPREREILDLIASGHGNKQIARALGITEKTVKAHCTRLFARIGAEDRTQAAIWALRNRPAAEPFSEPSPPS